MGKREYRKYKIIVSRGGGSAMCYKSKNLGKKNRNGDTRPAGSKSFGWIY